MANEEGRPAGKPSEGGRGAKGSYGNGRSGAGKGGYKGNRGGKPGGGQGRGGYRGIGKGSGGYRGKREDGEGGKREGGFKPRGERGDRDRSENRGFKPRGDRSFSRRDDAQGASDEKRSYKPRGERNDRSDNRSYKPRGDRNSDRSFNRDRREGAQDGGKGGYKGMGGKGYAGPKRKQSSSTRNHSKVSPARRAALDALTKVHDRDAFAQNVMESVFAEIELSPADRSFASLLTLGVVRTQGTLDWLIDRILNNPDDVSKNVREALRISAYEIIFLDKSPYAAVDQGVELVRSITPRAAGLANAVLRSVAQQKEEFPFGDATTDVEAFARSLGFPTWLAQLFLQDMGNEAGTQALRASNEPAPVYLAVNYVKATDEEVLAVLKDVRAKAQPVDLGWGAIPGCYKLGNAQAVNEPAVKTLFVQGKVLVSDAASQAVAQLVVQCINRSAKGATASVLEVGSGRGTKTVLLNSLAARAGMPEMDYIAMDNMDFKVELVGKRAAQYGFQLKDALTADATKLDEAVPGMKFNTIFIDAPCSGLGTLRRHPEIRWRVTPEAIAKSCALQAQLLESAAGHVAPGGMLLYATCSVTKQENEHVVSSFLKSPAGAGFKLLAVQGKPALATPLRPGSGDGHFCACMMKAEEPDA